MEIKIQCDCGQKFKFDVEPVNGKMPYTVTCPVCGRDDTAKADTAIAQTSAPSSSAPGVRISQPRQTANISAIAPPVPGTHTSPARAGRASSDHTPLWHWIVAIVILVVLFIGAYNFAEKWTKRITILGEAAEIMRESSGETPEDSHVETWTLPNDDGTVVLVKHTNETAVAQACAEYWQQTFRKRMTLVTTSNLFATDDDALYLVEPAWNNCVKIDGPIFWDEKQAAIMDAMAKFLSTKFATTTVSALMGDDAEGGVFTVFERGEMKFRCERHMVFRNNDIEEVVKIEGEAWATGLGFKPGEGGFKGFTMDDANSLTHHLGLKTAGRPEIESCIELREPGRVGQQ